MRNCKCLKIILIVCIHAAFSSREIFNSVDKKNFEAGKASKMSKIEEKNTATDCFLKRNERSISGLNLLKQFDQICRGSGIQPCTCNYPDHPNVTQFQLDVTESTRSVSGVNGTGPANCDDLETLGYTLNGFYLVRFSSKRNKAVYCELSRNPILFNNHKMIELENPLKLENSKKLRFCGGFGREPCKYFYSDYPDVMLSSKNVANSTLHRGKSTEPRSCKDLVTIGHNLPGFYIVMINAIKVKIVFCDFNATTSKQNIITRKARSIPTKSRPICKGFGSQPCSCFYSNYPNILQFELGTDEITLAASGLNGSGPTSCKDLETLGHVLKGFYIVRHKDKIMKTIFCQFASKFIKEKNHSTTKDKDRKPGISPRHNIQTTQMPPKAKNILGLPFKTSKPVITMQPNIKRIADSSIKSATTIGIYSRTSTKRMKAVQIEPDLKNKKANNSLKSATTIGPLTENSTKTMTNIQIGPDYKNKEGPSFKSNKTIPLKHYSGKSYPLVNIKHGKCLAVETGGNKKPDENGAKIIQSDCNLSEKGQLWKYGKDYSLCNDWNKCASIPSNHSKGRTLDVFQWDRIVGKTPQMWYPMPRKDQLVNTGYCLAFERNSNDHAVIRAITEICSPDDGQVWSFLDREESNITLSTTEVKLRPTTKRQNLTTSDAVNKLTTGGPALTDKLPLQHPFDTYFPLMNTNGKCLAVETTGTIKPSENGAKIIQADCNPSEKGQRWKWDRKNETLCNEWNKCISSPFNQKWGQTFDVFHWDLADPKNCSQIWLLSNVGKIVHSRLCLTFKGNSDAHGAKAFTDFCNIAKIWSFYRY